PAPTALSHSSIAVFGRSVGAGALAGVESPFNCMIFPVRVSSVPLALRPVRRLRRGSGRLANGAARRAPAHEAVGRLLALGRRPLALGRRPLALGRRPLALGRRLLAVGGRLLAGAGRLLAVAGRALSGAGHPLAQLGVLGSVDQPPGVMTRREI